MSKVKLLSEDYDLTEEGSISLCETMIEVCHVYIRCRNEISTETESAWGCVVRVAEEIIKRR